VLAKAGSKLLVGVKIILSGIFMLGKYFLKNFSDKIYNRLKIY
jgi:hypothetical protein